METITRQQIKEIIRAELPALMEEDPAFRSFVMRVSSGLYADKLDTDSRFYMILEELRRDRENNIRKFDEWSQKWEEERQEAKIKWEMWEKQWEEERQETKIKWEMWEKQWEEERRESKIKWEMWEKQWEEERQEQKRRWELTQQKNNEYQGKFEKFQEEMKTLRYDFLQIRHEIEHVSQENQKILERLEALDHKYDSRISAVGARWGIQTEESFREAFRTILEKTFKVEVTRLNIIDKEGIVFGRRDQVELDMIIRNGILILCEIKSSMSKPDMYAFWRKVQFYIKQYQETPNRLIVISPWIDDKAKEVAKDLDIEMCTYPGEVKME